LVQAVISTGIVMDEKTQLLRIAELGISNFESLEEVHCRQADMLDCLASSFVARHVCAGLSDCRGDHCGRVNCIEACWFGTRRRRLEQIPAIYDLLQKSGQPLHEVRVVRGVWTRRAEDLALVNIKAAKQLNARLLDRTYNPSVVAVGMFNAFKGPEGLVHKREPGEPDLPDPLWICEIHQIVAGAEKDALERAFSIPLKRDPGAIFSEFWQKPVKKLGKVVGNVFRRDLRGKSRPWLNAGNPSKRERREFYSWLLSLRPDARLIRYGCDEHFKKVEGKKPRRFVLASAPQPPTREDKLAKGSALDIPCTGA
jgi:hypothetical protein